MNSLLLAISVGPVQEFIAAARRTRDLWFGSYLLSEISKAVARSLSENGGKLIFPNLDTNLEPGHPEINVSNVILAELSTDNPAKIAATAKCAAKDCWMCFAKETFDEARGVIRSEIWDDQVNDVIEFYAAWVERSGTYLEDRKRLMRLLAGRKNCRDFQPANGRAGVPKSSLDGQRESVLKDPEKWHEQFRARLRVRKGEQLDVVGLVKRVAGGTQPYPSVSRIAADPWVRGNVNGLDLVKAACEVLGTPVIRKLDLSDAKGHPHFTAFGFEGTAVYKSRHHELIEETEVTDDELFALREALGQLPEPSPYLSVLVADGDRIGAAISKLETPGKHREFSNVLATFANDAKRVVNDHNGVLIYAGGDDVLAFLPVDTSLACARKLHDKFGELLSSYKNDDGLSPTLSVGIAIGHFMDNLEDLLDYGRVSEKAAKKVDGKDALAVHLHKRGGGPIEVKASWKEKDVKASLDIRLVKFAELMLDGTIPTKLPYELRNMAKVYESWEKGDVTETAIQLDLERLIAKKQSKGIEKVRKALDGYIDKMNATKLIAFAQELLIARQIAVAIRQATRPSRKQEQVPS